MIQIILNFLKKYWKWILIVLLIGAIVVLYLLYTKAVKDKERYYGDTIELTDNYRDISGKFVSVKSANVVTISELKKQIESGDSMKGKLLKEISDMKIKIKNVESAGTIVYELRDTIFVPKLVFVGGSHCFDYTDGFMTLNIQGDSVGSNITYKYADHLTWAVSTYFIDKWKFKNLFVKRPKYVKINAKFDNPKSIITYQEFIKITK